MTVYNKVLMLCLSMIVLRALTLATAHRDGDGEDVSSKGNAPKFLYRGNAIYDPNHVHNVHNRLARALRIFFPDDFENVTLPVYQTKQETFNSQNRPRKLTLSHAHQIHEFALEASHQVQRSHGHVVKSSSNSFESMTKTSCRSRSKRSRNAKSLIFSPFDYGADPTGVEDSTEAFLSMMKEFLSVRPSRPMAANITNLGGATIDLQGGQYLLSQPIVIPPMYGNAHIVDGTLQASATFPTDRWIIEIGNVQTCRPVLPDGRDDPQSSCNQFIDVTSILLDANFVAAGGVRVSRVMGTTLTNVFVTGFVQVGILISNGHEVMVTHAWLAECYWSTNKWCRENQSRSVGIRIDGMDHYITNTIVFDFAKVGVEVWQPANILEGVHTWNGGGHGIVVGQNASHTTHSVRLLGCYLDFETLDLWDPSNILVESTFFYFGHAVLKAGDKANVNGLIMRFNHYNTNQSVALEGTFAKVQSASIEEELDWVKTTKASQRLELKNSTEFRFDFTEQLLFPSVIDRVSYSLTSSSDKVVSHMARPPNGTEVTVVTSDPIDGAVYMTVEQGKK